MEECGLSNSFLQHAEWQISGANVAVNSDATLSRVSVWF